MGGKQIAKRGAVPEFTVFGLIGCGVGALVGSLIGWAIAANTGPGLEDPAVALEVVSIWAYLIMGAGGGATLGLASKKRKIPVVALVGAVSFGIALLFGFGIQAISFDIFAGLSKYAAIAIRSAITGAIFGAVGGAVLGLVLRGWKGARFLALAGVIPGAIIFATQFIMAEMMPETTALITISGLVITGVAMGAALGAALGYLEKMKDDTQSQVS